MKLFGEKRPLTPPLTGTPVFPEGPGRPGIPGFPFMPGKPCTEPKSGEGGGPLQSELPVVFLMTSDLLTLSPVSPFTLPEGSKGAAGPGGPWAPSGPLGPSLPGKPIRP